MKAADELPDGRAKVCTSLSLLYTLSCLGLPTGRWFA
jgi:hypothetical protein